MGCQRKAWDNEGFLDAEMSLIIAFQTKEPLLCISYTTHSSLKFGTGEKKCLSNDTTKVIFTHRYTNVYHVGRTNTGAKWELTYWMYSSNKITKTQIQIFRRHWFWLFLKY